MDGIGRMIQIKPHVYSMGGSLIVGQNTSEQNVLRLERDLVCGVEIKEKYGENSGGERK